MARTSTERDATARRPRPHGAWLAVLFGVCASCAEVLGIPSDPELVEPASPVLGEGSTPDAASSTPTMPPRPASGAEPVREPERTSADGVSGDGVVPGENIASLEDGQQDLSRPAPGAPLPEPVDAGAPDTDAARVPPSCVGVERAPVDVVFLVDNSGSMREEAAAFERALPAFVERLDEGEVDHRIILLSRHRRNRRSATEEASTSVCIAAPVSELAACPSERPRRGQRFFPYSLAIHASDSFERALEAFASPDPFELTSVGWSEWLRVGARKIFIEITDADSATSAGDFLAALSAAAPEHFGADPARPDLVFHSVLGLAEKALALDIYTADEPIETDVCDGVGSNPENAGEIYQELSRLTGGLRLSICPVAAFGTRLAALAADVVERSSRPCPVAP